MFRMGTLFPAPIGTASVLSVNYVGTVGRHLLSFVESNPGDQALCLQLSDPANVAPGSTTCGPLAKTRLHQQPTETVSGTRPLRHQLNSNPYMKTAAAPALKLAAGDLEHTEKYLNFLMGTPLRNRWTTVPIPLTRQSVNPGQNRHYRVFNVPIPWLPALRAVALRSLYRGGDLGEGFTAGWNFPAYLPFQSEPVGSMRITIIHCLAPLTPTLTCQATRKTGSRFM